MYRKRILKKNMKKIKLLLRHVLLFGSKYNAEILDTMYLFSNWKLVNQSLNTAFKAEKTCILTVRITAISRGFKFLEIFRHLQPAVRFGQFSLVRQSH